MSNYRSVILVLLLSFSLLASQCMGQNPKADQQQGQKGKTQKQKGDKPAKEKKERRGSYVLLKAVEQSGKWDITVDYGKDKELFTDSERDQEAKKTFDAVLETGSLVDVVNVLNTKGLEISNAYTVTEKTTTHFIWLMRPSKANKAGGAAAGAKGGKSTMTKEERQKRR